MTYLSVCSGIEAATVAWHGIMEPVAFSEIEPFANAVLAHHYPDVPNLGDMTQFKEWTIERTVDVLVGGTPCQSFSVAGLRRGLDDPRGSLMLVYLALARHHRPRWVVWENVPGVLSSNGGRDFGSFLAGLGELGYGWAYRVLDAQYFGVPQRRRRVFVVGYLGDWRPPAAVLFEPHSLSGNPPPRLEAGERVAASLTRGADSGGRGGYAGRRQEDDANIVALPLTSRVDRGGEHREAHGNNLVAATLTGGGVTERSHGKRSGSDRDTLVAHPLRAQANASHREDSDTYIARSINAHPGGRYDGDTETFVTHSLRADGLDASEDGTGRGTPLVIQDARGMDKAQNGKGWSDDGVAYTMDAQATQAIAFDTTQITSPDNYSNPKPGDPCHPLAEGAHAPAVAQAMSVRRLTPREAERLQGFPDDYTLVTYRGKPAADGPRYKALGNSMAVPVMRWIGRRIVEADKA